MDHSELNQQRDSLKEKKTFDIYDSEEKEAFNLYKQRIIPFSNILIKNKMGQLIEMANTSTKRVMLTNRDIEIKINVNDPRSATLFENDVTFATCFFKNTTKYNKCSEKIVFSKTFLIKNSI
jgi:hypothetical protein